MKVYWAVWLPAFPCHSLKFLIDECVDLGAQPVPALIGGARYEPAQRKWNCEHAMLPPIVSMEVGGTQRFQSSHRPNSGLLNRCPTPQADCRVYESSSPSGNRDYFHDG